MKSTPVVLADDIGHLHELRPRVAIGGDVLEPWQHPGAVPNPVLARRGEVGPQRRRGSGDRGGTGRRAPAEGKPEQHHDWPSIFRMYLIPRFVRSRCLRARSVGVTVMKFIYRLRANASPSTFPREASISSAVL